jgi:hypothetical protein
MEADPPISLASKLNPYPQRRPTIYAVNHFHHKHIFLSEYYFTVKILFVVSNSVYSTTSLKLNGMTTYKQLDL